MDYTTRFYLSGFLRIAFYSGFFLVYLQEIGLSKAQIGFLMGLSLILVALLEVPTGVVADRVSKKLSVLLSEGLSVLYVTVLYLASSFPMVLASMIIAALATAFRTGAETAWVYELLSRDGRANDYPRVYGRLRAFELAGGLVG
ncbi:MFS transporter [Thermococcus sp. JCM 11816]